MKILQNKVRNIAALMVSSATLLPAICAAQNGTTASQALSSARAYDFKPGAQFVYAATGKLSLERDEAKSESLDSLTTYTVLSKTNDVYTILGVTDMKAPSKGDNYIPAGRYTFELPAIGAEPGKELNTSGLTSDAMPGISLEDIFSVAKNEGETTETAPLPLTGMPAPMKSVTKKSGDNIITTWQLENAKGDSYADTTSTFSQSKGLHTSIASQAKLEAPTQDGSLLKYSTDIKFELKTVAAIPEKDVEALKADVSKAIPLTEKMMKLSMSDPKVFKELASQIDSYIAEHPKGSFAPFLGESVKQLKEMVERIENWEKNKVGETAQDFTVKTLDDKEIKLSALKGKVVLLDFWATWCPPCVMTIPHLKELYAKNKEKGLEIIGISSDHEKSDLTDFIKEHDLTWPMVFEGGDEPGKNTATVKYGITSFPTMIVVGKDGKITHILSGAQSDLDSAIAEALGEKK